ncbi:hypothetical protein NEOLEDRAFT_1055211 [Neolentinus lepideus HHB14362 ss-1]|uniref:SWIM-type domain-containing protein n=1 Tax=Neolentinus lepideus HHB14362 ss-1 TaxID=1314782 RepID=A0A165VVB6_9AGAM|nr:hypothetical protein NEOLEDRAFT_1055211 [Neolentinus lepideus HHB14362 ss-1]
MAFRESWLKLAEKPISTGSNYDTNIVTWTCAYGGQKYNAYHLCKHLVQAVPTPTPWFWQQIYRR